MNYKTYGYRMIPFFIINAILVSLSGTTRCPTMQNEWMTYCKCPGPYRGVEFNGPTMTINCPIGDSSIALSIIAAIFILFTIGITQRKCKQYAIGAFFLICALGTVIAGILVLSDTFEESDLQKSSCLYFSEHYNASCNKNLYLACGGILLLTGAFFAYWCYQIMNANLQNGQQQTVNSCCFSLSTASNSSNNNNQNTTTDGHEEVKKNQVDVKVDSEIKYTVQKEQVNDEDNENLKERKNKFQQEQNVAPLNDIDQQILMHYKQQYLQQAGEQQQTDQVSQEPKIEMEYAKQPNQDEQKQVSINLNSFEK